METSELSDFGYKIFADRYSLKSEEFSEGDNVIFTRHDGTVAMGKVKEQSRYTATISFSEKERDYVIVPVHSVKLPVEKPDDLWQRVAENVAVAEGEDKVGWEGKFYHLLKDWRFIPAGRILSAAGRGNLTYYNCFVLPSPQDSKEGILETLQRMVHIMSRGGGVGINISSLRPKGSNVNGVDGKSSGAVSWGDLYSFATGLISSGGSRRGALGLIMDDRHPDILDFVKSKREEGKAFSNANISVAISDEFMTAVEKDMDWHLIFPETTHSDYDIKWDGDYNKWIATGLPVKIYTVIRARELWDAIVESAWTNGEPGIWFIDRANEMSNSYYIGRLRCTNPCFEEPLPDWGVCCLGSLNLPKFITPDSKTVVWDELSEAVNTAVRFLDDVIDVTPYLDNESMLVQASERRIGLGTLGLAELLIRLKLRYGSKDSLVFIDKLYSFIAHHAYRASSLLAQEKGNCPAYDKEKFLASGFMQTTTPLLRENVIDRGIRNMTLLTQAPTGSIATMVGTSTGIEPFFDFRYTRTSQLGVDEEYVKVYAEWKEAHPGEPLPDYFVTTKDITVDEHVAVQSTVQRWVDASISKTVNLPKEATRDDVSSVFKKLYQSGCKGGTIYRDESRIVQVLNRQPEEAQHQSTDDIKFIKDLPYKRQGVTVSSKTPFGTAHITMNNDEAGQPFEVFIEVGKAGSSVKAMSEAIGRLISLCLRITPECPVLHRVVYISEQLSGIGGRLSTGFGNKKVMSLPDAIGKVIRSIWLNDNKQNVSNTLPENLKDSCDLCPVCGHTTLIAAEGCFHCTFCGFAEC